MAMAAEKLGIAEAPEQPHVDPYFLDALTASTPLTTHPSE